MDRFEQEAMDLEADIIRNLSERAAPRIAAWGRRCYAEGRAAGLAEGEAKCAKCDCPTYEDTCAMMSLRQAYKEAESKLAALTAELEEAQAAIKKAHDLIEYRFKGDEDLTNAVIVLSQALTPDSAGERKEGR